MEKHLTLPQNVREGGGSFLFAVLMSFPALLSFWLLRPQVEVDELTFVAGVPLFLLFLLSQIAVRILPPPKTSPPANKKPTRWTYVVGFSALASIGFGVMALTTLASIPLYWTSKIESPVMAALSLAGISIGLSVILMGVAVSVIVYQRQLEANKKTQKPWQSKEILEKWKSTLPRASSVIYSTFFDCFMRLSIR